MRKFDYSFLNNGLLPAGLVNLTASIASLKTMAGVRKDDYANVFTELEAIAKMLLHGFYLCGSFLIGGRYMAESEKQSIKEQLAEITARIEDGIKDLFQSDKYAQYLKTMSRFHNYSFNNTMLIFILWRMNEARISITDSGDYAPFFGIELSDNL